MKDMNYVLIGNDLLLRVDQIVSANLSSKDKDGNPCIKVRLLEGAEWTLWSNLSYSKEVLRSIANVNDNYDLIQNIKGVVLKKRHGRESSVSKEIKNLIQE